MYSPVEGEKQHTLGEHLRSYPTFAYGIPIAEVGVIMRTPLLLSVLALMAVAPAALVACSSQEKDDTSSSEANQTSTEGEPFQAGDEGSVCWDSSECAQGLICKRRPSGPPPGAVGLPVPSSETRGRPSGPPPGAVGMPLPPNTCQVPSPGEEGSQCSASSECNEGLVCDFGDDGSSSGGMPPGAVGMPVPSSSAEGHSFPPGAMGMPVMPRGTCAQDQGSSSSGGPPPGAVGLPIHH